MRWHRRETYGFLHFTVNTFTNREWGYGDESPAVFAPTELDCTQWVAAAKAGGLRGLILTAKHHDGFCLWPTATTDHHVGNSPFRGGAGDVVGELAEACAAGGLELGLYCSPWDRNHPDYGRPAYVDAYHAQWEELLTRYGPLCELWLDGANGGDGYYGGARESRSIDPATYYRLDELVTLFRRHQPEAVVFSDAGPDVRWCGNEKGYASATTWCMIRPEGFVPGSVADYQRLVEGDTDGAVWRPVEVDVSMRPGWFWHPTERPKSPDELFAVWLASVGRGAGLNLNLTPDSRGLIPSEDVLSLTRFAQRREAFTAIDLASTAQVTVQPSGNGPDTGGADALIDGIGDTWWAAGGVPATVQVAFQRQEPIAGVRIEEAIAYGQRVSGFALDVGDAGHWYEWARGTTIGAQRIIPTDGATGNAVRLRILDALAPPVLSRIFVYAAGHR
jgi:alpha-L-fucosidase